MRHALLYFAFLTPLASAQEAWFHDITEQALPGIRTVSGSSEKNWILEVNGGGLGLEDLNGDGHLDLVVVDGSTLERVRADEPGLPPRVFLGRGDGGFEPAGEAWSMDSGGWGTGLALGDVDGDGWCDLLVAQWGELRLFRNEQGRGLKELADTGLAGGGWHSSAAFHDLNQDGLLDLVVTRYLEFDPGKVLARGASGARWKGQAVMLGPEGMTPQADRLFWGKGDGTFREDLRAFEGVEAGFGLGLVICDLDGDRRPDVYVSNDSTPNHLWMGRPEGALQELGFERGVSHGVDGREQAGMGIAVGREGGQVLPSLFVTNFSGESNALYRPSKRGRGYRERSARAGLSGPSRPLLGWGTGFMDADLDGHLDLWVLNGHVYPQADAPGTDTSYAQVDQLFVSDGSGLEPQNLTDGDPRVSRSGVAGDLDGDGDLDLVVLTMDGPVRVLRNDAKHRGHWIAVGLRAKGPNRDGIGALVTVAAGEERWSAEVHRSGGFQAARPARQVFGLGNIEAVDRIEVQWPSGEVQVLDRPAFDRLHWIEEKAQ